MAQGKRGATGQDPAHKTMSNGILVQGLHFCVQGRETRGVVWRTQADGAVGVDERCGMGSKVPPHQGVDALLLPQCCMPVGAPVPADHHATHADRLTVGQHLRPTPAHSATLRRADSLSGMCAAADALLRLAAAAAAARNATHYCCMLPNAPQTPRCTCPCRPCALPRSCPDRPTAKERNHQKHKQQQQESQPSGWVSHLLLCGPTFFAGNLPGPAGSRSPNTRLAACR